MVVPYAYHYCIIISGRAFHSRMSWFGDNSALWYTDHMTSETVWLAVYPSPALGVLRGRVGRWAGSGKNRAPGRTGV